MCTQFDYVKQYEQPENHQMWSILRSAYPALSYVLNTEVVHTFSVYVYFFNESKTW